MPSSGIRNITKQVQAKVNSKYTSVLWGPHKCFYQWPIYQFTTLWSNIFWKTRRRCLWTADSPYSKLSRLFFSFLSFGKLTNFISCCFSSLLSLLQKGRRSDYLWEHASFSDRTHIGNQDTVVLELSWKLQRHTFIMSKTDCYKWDDISEFLVHSWSGKKAVVLRGGLPKSHRVCSPVSTPGSACLTLQAMIFQMLVLIFKAIWEYFIPDLPLPTSHKICLHLLLGNGIIVYPSEICSCYLEHMELMYCHISSPFPNVARLESWLRYQIWGLIHPPRVAAASVLRVLCIYIY